MRRVIIALVLLAACAPVQSSSLPFVRIDRSLSGPVCSREALESSGLLRARERGEWRGRLVSCEGSAQLSGVQLEQAQQRLAEAIWWQQNGLWVVTVTGLIAAGIGVGVGIAAGSSR
jgi:hypothetical protein